MASVAISLFGPQERPVRVGLAQNTSNRYLSVFCAASPVLDKMEPDPCPRGSSLLEKSGPEAMDEHPLPHGPLSVPADGGGAVFSLGWTFSSSW